MPSDIISFFLKGKVKNKVKFKKTNMDQQHQLKEFLELNKFQNYNGFVTLDIINTNETKEENFSFIAKLLIINQPLFQVSLYLFINNYNNNMNDPDLSLNKLKEYIEIFKLNYPYLIDQVNNIIVCGKFNLPLTVNYNKRNENSVIINSLDYKYEVNNTYLAQTCRKRFVKMITELLAPFKKKIRAAYAKNVILEDEQFVIQENNYQQTFNSVAIIFISENLGHTPSNITSSIHNPTLEKDVVMKDFILKKKLPLIQSLNSENIPSIKDPEEEYLLHNYKLIIFTFDNLIHVVSTYVSLEKNMFKLQMQRLPEMLQLIGISSEKINAIFRKKLLKELELEDQTTNRAEISTKKNICRNKTLENPLAIILIKSTPINKDLVELYDYFKHPVIYAFNETESAKPIFFSQKNIYKSLENIQGIINYNDNEKNSNEQEEPVKPKANICFSEVHAVATSSCQTFTHNPYHFS